MKNFCLIFSVLIIILLTACSKSNEIASFEGKVYEIPFQLFYQDKPLDCDNHQILDFRLYIYDLELGQSAVSSSPKNKIQLLDFISSYECKNQLMLEVSKLSNQSELNFTLGVPSGLNHQNPVKAEYPLNLSAMHWQWLSGYKFLRLEFENNDQVNRFHLGSWGCSGRIPDDVDCNAPNRIPILIPDFNIENSFVAVHLDALLDVETESLCMGSPNDRNCVHWLQALQHDVFKVGFVE